MITKDYVITMARYNRWQNNCLITVADGFDDATRKKDGGVFFQSIHQTFNHLLWADGIWLSRFTNDGTQHLSLQQSVSLFDQWQALKTARTAMDEKIIAWAKAIDPAWLKSDSVLRNSKGLERPLIISLMHFFNHQTHHRGQIHALLTRFGGQTLDTDLFLLPAE